MIPLRRLPLLLAALTAAAVAFATQTYIGYRVRSLPVSYVPLLVLELCHWSAWSYAAPLGWSLARRWPIRPPHRLRRLIAHTLAALAIVGSTVIAFWGIYLVLVRLPGVEGWYPGFDKSPLGSLMFFGTYSMQIGLIVYAAIVAVAHAVHANAELQARARESMRLASELATARLQVLTAQLQPHFLFNTLHTINSLILQRQNDRATEMLAELGELLRVTLDRRNAALIPLADEIAHLTRYLRIEEARFGDRLTVRWNVEPAALAALVPPLILQPIVENALKHGIAHRVEPGVIDVRAFVAGGRLRLSVYNDGPTLAGAWSPEGAAGFGLRNVHDRLLTRDPSAALRLRNVGDAGVVSEIDMPLLTALEPAHA